MQILQVKKLNMKMNEERFELFLSLLGFLWPFTFPAVAKYSPSGDHSIKCTDTEVLEKQSDTHFSNVVHCTH